MSWAVLTLTADKVSQTIIFDHHLHITQLQGRVPVHLEDSDDITVDDDHDLHEESLSLSL